MIYGMTRHKQIRPRACKRYLTHSINQITDRAENCFENEVLDYSRMTASTNSSENDDCDEIYKRESVTSVSNDETDINVDLSSNSADECSYLVKHPINTSPNSEERIHMCKCGISFTSIKTLEAHKEFYCSFRLSEDNLKEKSPKNQTKSTSFNTRSISYQINNLIQHHSTESVQPATAIHHSDSIKLASTNSVVDNSTSITNTNQMKTISHTNMVVLATNPPIIVSFEAYKNAQTFSDELLINDVLHDGYIRRAYVLTENGKIRCLDNIWLPDYMSSNNQKNYNATKLTNEKVFSQQYNLNQPLDLRIDTKKIVKNSPDKLNESIETISENMFQSPIVNENSKLSPDDVFPTIYESRKLSHLSLQKQADMCVPKMKNSGNNQKFQCQNCGIKFISRKNFDIHQKHYCQNVNVSNIQKKNLNNPSTIMPKNACSNCGIFFTSNDTLTAHCEFYCTKNPKKNTKEIKDKESNAAHQEVTISGHCEEARCESLDSSASPEHLGKWLCPCCDTISHTILAAHQHVQTFHNTSRSYECSVCGYRGNTLRGMRSHVKVHTHSSLHTSDYNDEQNFITCVLPAKVENADNCDMSIKSCKMCLFRTSDKINLLRHYILTHLTMSPSHQLSVKSSDLLTTDKSQARESNHSNTAESSLEEMAIDVESEKTTLITKPTSSPRSRSSTIPSTLSISRRQSPLLPFINNKYQVSSVSNNSSVNVVNRLSPFNQDPTEGANTQSTPKLWHCSYCNIPFKQSSNYTAHVQFYCSRPDTQKLTLTSV